MLKLTGRLVEIEHVPPFERGDFKRDAFPRLHILAGREVYPVDIDVRTFSDALPGVEQPIEVELKVRAFAGKGGVRIAYDLVKIHSTADQAGRKAA
jgi:hypothetical protein